MTARRAAIRAREARCPALGFWPGRIDGIGGRRTRAAFEAATAAHRARGLPFQHPSGITRIQGRWTGGGHVPNPTDLRAYHGLIPAEGPPVLPVTPDTRRSHTLNANSGAIGLAICAMASAVERPWHSGRAPITPTQVCNFVREAARLCRLYDMPVTRWSVLTHAGIQPTLGIVQRWKWDITWLPGMSGPADPIKVGNHLRAMIRAELQTLWAAAPEPAKTPPLHLPDDPHVDQQVSQGLGPGYSVLGADQAVDPVGNCGDEGDIDVWVSYSPILGQISG